MRNILAAALLLSSYCEAGTLRKNDEGFEVVGSSPKYESFDVWDQPHRELFERQLIEEEQVDAAKEVVEDEREYVSA